MTTALPEGAPLYKLDPPRSRVSQANLSEHVITRPIFRIPHAGLLAVGLMLLLAACDLFSSEPDEGGVTHGPVPPVLHEFPRWSPDGTALLYYDTGLVSYNPDTHATIHDIDRRGIWVMNLETGQRRKLVSAGYADWSPDGSAIVFEAGQLYT
ncbi:MAG: hypothetical protein D6751_10245, partial [Deltaproteobacteria bacterium]